MVAVLSEKIASELVNSPRDRVLFIECDGAEVTCELFNACVSKYEDFFMQKKVVPGQHVGFYAERSSEFVAGLVAAIKIGAVAVPLDLHSTAERVRSVFEDAEVRFAICNFDEARQFLKKALPDIELYSMNEVRNSPDMKLRSEYREQTEDAAYMAYTSGTTGRPKGVVLSRRAIAAYVGWFATMIDRHDVFVMALPFSTAVSLVDSFAPFFSGCVGLMSPERHYKEPREFVKHMAAHGAGVLMLPAPVLHMLVSYGDLSTKSVPQISNVLFGASAYPTDQLRIMRKALEGVKVTHLYGNTETGIICSNPVPDSFKNDDELFLPVGRICSHLKGRIERHIPGMEFPQNEGELWVSGANIMTEYWKRPEQNDKKLFVDADGVTWYRTGDIARELSPGFYRLVGRIDRVFKKRGYQVEPEEVERQLSLLPEISALAVVPKKTPTDEVFVYAYIIKKSDGDLSILKLKKYCAERVPSHMIPDRFVFLSEFPKTTSGKIDYIKLSEMEDGRGGV